MQLHISYKALRCSSILQNIQLNLLVWVVCWCAGSAVHMWVLSVLLQWDWHMHQYCFFKFSCSSLFESLSMDGRRGCLADTDKQDLHMWTSPQRTLTMASLSSDNLGASGVERHMWAPTKLHQHWSAAALRCDILPCNTLMYFSCYPTLCSLWNIAMLHQQCFITP